MSLFAKPAARDRVAGSLVARPGRGRASAGRGVLVPSALLALITGPVACGASIQALYEGDVRFEHCMALDSRPDVKPTIRRACWEEWRKFYTFGQTRDRVDYALLREKQLSGASDFDEGEWMEASLKPSKAVPEPTTVLAPPPMMLNQGSDGGVANPIDGGARDGAAGADGGDGGDAAPPTAGCTAECEATWNFCRQECKTPACEKNCTGKYKVCMRNCF